MSKRDLSLDLLCHSLQRTTFEGKYTGFTLIGKLFLDFRTSGWDVTKQGVGLLFRLFGSFHSCIYISPDLWRRNSR